MSSKMTKVVLLELIEGEHQLLEGVILRVPVSRMTEPGVVGEWTVKDLLAHISVWERFMVVWATESIAGNEPEQLPPGKTWDDLDAWNQQLYEERRDLELEEVMQEWEQSYDAALEMVREAPEADLADPARFAWRQGSPLWEMVAHNTFWHYKEHRLSLAAWLHK